jgi:hypothetical protein
MKKITNKILIITGCVILIVNIVFVSIAIQKYKNGTLYEWFGNCTVRENHSDNRIIYCEESTDTTSQIVIDESTDPGSDTTVNKVMVKIR